ncbi:hypothetical protein V6Z12_A11G259600 [Gossypium hirsutum]
MTKMDPQAFIRLSIGSLGLRIPGSALRSSKTGIRAFSSPCSWWKGPHCGVGVKRQQIGTFKLEVGPEWGQGKPVILFNGWIGIGKNKHESGKPGAELHLRVQLDPDPRYVFQFEDVTMLSPQIVQPRGSIKQPIFSCEFSRDRVAKVDPLGTYWTGSADSSDIETERRERKGWKARELAALGKA